MNKKAKLEGRRGQYQLRCFSGDGKIPARWAERKVDGTVRVFVANGGVKGRYVDIERYVEFHDNPDLDNSVGLDLDHHEGRIFVAQFLLHQGMLRPDVSRSDHEFLPVVVQEKPSLMVRVVSWCWQFLCRKIRFTW